MCIVQVCMMFVAVEACPLWPERFEAPNDCMILRIPSSYFNILALKQITYLQSFFLMLVILFL